MPRIIRNAIRCKKCGDIIESKTVHDFKFCSCGSCAVDGGHDYLRRCGNREDWEELSKAEKVEDNGNWWCQDIIYHHSQCHHELPRAGIVIKKALSARMQTKVKTA